MAEHMDANNMTFFEHLDALRPRLFRSVAVLFIGMIVAFLAKDVVISIIMGPQSPEFLTNRAMAMLADRMGSEVLRINSSPLNLVNTAMAGQLNLHLMASFYTALLLAIPYSLVELWGFIRPALTTNEIKNGRFFIACIALCMCIGVAFGYFILTPLSVNFLGSYCVSEAITNMIDIGSYISLVANMTIVCAIVFEMPVAVYFLSRLGILSADTMRHYRRHAFVIMAIGSAIITPPDVASMVLVIIPMYALYEFSTFIAKRNE